MRDIVLFDSSKGDSVIVDTDLYKADNLLHVQEGDLLYMTDFGIDLKYFFNPDFKIENIVFVNYLQQQIAKWHMNIIDLKSTLDNFIEKIQITLAPSEENNVVIGD